MKNIHILPTDEPSRLVLETVNNNLFLTTTTKFPSTIMKFQNIYITNDEEIKEGDWYYYFGHVVKYNSDENTLTPNCKKIILTTDQDLIKDGVQAIDDEFLEWFVKNSSCEEVEVKPLRKSSGWYDEKEIWHWDFLAYKIIIPKEDLEQCKTPLDCGKVYNEELTTQTITCSKCGNTHTFPFGEDYYCPSPKQRLEKYSERFDNDKSPIGNPETWGKRLVNETIEENVGKKTIEYCKQYEGTDKYNVAMLAIEFGYQLKLQEDDKKRNN